MSHSSIVTGSLEIMELFSLVHSFALILHRYGPYVIAMAHRVIAQWFVVCRLHCRPAVARYISKTLTTDLKVTSRRPIGSQTSESRASIGLELMEVCQDMMARYTYSNLSTLPSR